MDNWKCTGILRGDGSPVNSGHAAALSVVGVPGAAQMVVGAASAGRYVMVLLYRGMSSNGAFKSFQKDYIYELNALERHLQSHNCEWKALDF